jgi:hypothetical protein
MRPTYVLGLPAALAVVAATTAFSPAVPHAPARHAAAHRLAGGRYCAVVVDKARSRHQHSRVVSRSCADSPQAASLRSAKADNTLLVTVYQDINYGGAQTSIYGRGGPCDSSGYTLNDTSGANSAVNGISSYRLFSSCNKSSIFTGTDRSGTGSSVLSGDQAYVGDAWNDNVNSMIIWKG